MTPTARCGRHREPAVRRTRPKPIGRSRRRIPRNLWNAANWFRIAKRLSGISCCTCLVAWPDRVVPLTVELIADEIERGHLLVRDGDPFGVAVRIELATHAQPRLGRGAADQIDDHLIADQRPGAPVHADEREQAVFDLVPLRGAGREMVDTDLDTKFVSQALQLPFPQPHARAVAAAPVGCDRETACAGVTGIAELVPPRADRVYGECRRVMVNPDGLPPAEWRVL